MALDATQFKTAIEALPNGSEIYAFHMSMVEAERSRGIEESRKANQEAQSMRRYKIALEKLPGFDKDADLDKFIDNLKVVTTKAGDADAAKMSLEQVVAELNNLKKDYSKTTAELQAEKQRADQIKADSVKKTLTSKLTSVLADKIYNHDAEIYRMVNSGQVVLGDDESVQFIDGTNKLSLDQGVAKLLESRSDIVKNSQRPGASSTAPGGRPQVRYTPEQLQTMSKDDALANIKDVKASLGISS